MTGVVYNEPAAPAAVSKPGPAACPDGDAVGAGASPLEGCHVVFVLPHLGPGGAQRVATLVANEWAQQGLKVGLITTLDDKPDVHQLDPAVRRVRLRDAVVFGGARTTDSGLSASGIRLAVRRMHDALLAADARIEDLLRSERLAFGAGDQSRGEMRDEAGVQTNALAGSLHHGLLHGFTLRVLFLVSLLFFIRLPIQSYCAIRIMLRRTAKVAVEVVAPLIPTLERLVVRSALWRSFRLGLPSVELWAARTLVGRSERNLRYLLEAAPPPRLISFLTKTNIYTTLAAWNLSTHVVISERNDPDLQHLEPIWQRLRIYSYRRADLATSNSDGVLRKMRRFCDKRRLQLLPNPLVLSKKASGIVARAPHFIIVARLVHQKAIDVLLDAFARIADEAPDWRLEVVGDGPLRDELGQLAKRLGIAESVDFRGHVANPLDHLQTAGVFVLPSRFEGMPNSLLEAMASGVPPIVSDASPGPVELVHDGKTGLVVPVDDADALAAAMLRLAKDEAYRRELGTAARTLVWKHDWSVVERTWRDALRLPLSNCLPPDEASCVCRTPQ